MRQHHDARRALEEEAHDGAPQRPALALVEGGEAPAVPSGGEAAPASSPTPSGGDTAVSGESSVPGVESAGNEFDGLGGFDEIEVAPQPEPVMAPPVTEAKPATVAQPAPAQPAPAAAPVPAQPAPVAPQTAPQENASVQAPASAGVPADAAGLLREFEANREGIIDALAADARFGLSADEATLLETDPGKAVPRLLARTYYMAMNAALAHINNLVPGMINRQVEGTRIQTEREGAFYKKFPVLDRSKHHNEVMNFARIFRQQDPNMEFEQLTSLVGAAVMARNGLAPGMANGSPTVVQPATAAPFVPARPGVSVQTTPMDDNPFMGLGQDYD